MKIITIINHYSLSMIMLIHDTAIQTICIILEDSHLHYVNQSTLFSSCVLKGKGDFQSGKKERN